MPADNDSQSTDRSGRRTDPMAEHKRRARWRLLGAVIVVAAVGVAAPFFLEDAARPLSQDLLIEIPSRNSLFTKIDKLKPAESSAPSSVGADTGREASAPKASTEAGSATSPAVATSSAPATHSASSSASTPAAALPSSSAKPEPALEPKADASKKPGKGFLVQVGVYSKAETAKSVQAKLTLGGHKVWLEPVSRDDGVERYRVRIGPFETREQANEVRDRAKSQGYEAIVVINP